MCVKLKRVLSFVSAVVICGVSCVTSWFSVPVSAAGGFCWLEWAEFESLLQGVGFSSGGGGYKNVQEATLDWLNMTSDQFYKLTDPTDGGTAKPIWEQSWWGDMTDWLDHVFGGDDGYSKVSDVGAGGSGGSSFGQLSDDGTCYRVSFPSSDYCISNSSNSIWFLLWSDDSRPVPNSVTVNFINLRGRLCLFCTSDSYAAWQSSKIKGIKFASDPDGNFGMILQKLSPSPVSGFSYYYAYNDYSVEFWSDYFSLLRDNGINIAQFDGGISDYLNSFSDVKFSTSDGFIGPVYTYPAAQDLYKSTGTSAGIRLDVQTQDGVPDIQAALDGAGVKTVDDLVAGVAAGTVPMSKVFADAKVTPYVVADTATGAVVTDLGVSATATGVKAVGLTQELAVPKDLTNAAAYTIKGKTWDPDMAKYKLPLFQFFPFCLPWDIYEVLTLFDAEPVAPKFTIPVGQFFTRFSGSVDTSKAADQKAVIDLGSDSWQSTFKVIRALECAAIIIGLCLTAVLLIHGGR